MPRRRARTAAGLLALLLALLQVVWLPPAAVLAQGTAGASNGDLLQAIGDDKIYLVENGRRRWIADTRSMQRLNPDLSRLRHVPFEEVDRLPPGRPYRQGEVIRDAATGRVYLLTQETGWPAPRRRWVNDLDAFTRLGFVWEDVMVSWPTPASSYADAPALSYRPLSRELTTVQTSLGPLLAVPFWRLQVEDERLFVALALAATYGAQWREQVAPRLADQGTWITWGELPEQAAGVFMQDLNRIVVSGSQSNETPGVLTTTVAHEALHAVYPHGLTAASCVQEEARAYAIEVQTWLGLPAQYRQSSTPAGRFEQRLATYWQQQGLAGLEQLVASDPTYRSECSLV